MTIFNRRPIHYTKLNQRKQEVGMVQFYFFRVREIYIIYILIFQNFSIDQNHNL